MAGYHHPKLSPSCVERAFGHIHWTTIHHHHEEGRGRSRRSSSHDNLFSTIAAISRPELALLQSAEDHPLEYTLASEEDAFVYTRILLKVLDQVTSGGASSNSSHGTTSPISSSPQRVFSEPSSLSRVPQYSHSPSHEHHQHWSVADFSLETPLLSEEEAVEVYHHDPKGVVTHYVLSKLYDMIGLVLEAQRDVAISARNSSSNNNNNSRRRPSEQRQQLQLSALFYHPETRQLLDDWRPLLRICYCCCSPHAARRRSLNGGDEYSQRGASILLAYILKAGCDLEDSDRGNKQVLPQRQRRHANIDRYCSEGAQHFDHLDAPEEGTLLPPFVMHVIEEKKSSQSFDYNDMSPFPTPKGSLKGGVPSNSSSNHVQETLQSLISWLTSRLQSSHTTPLGVVTPTLMVLATTPQARIAFDHAGGIGYLARHLKQFAKQNHRRRSTTTHRSPIKQPQPYQDDEMNSFTFVVAANAVASAVLSPTRASSTSKQMQQQFSVRRNCSLSSFHSTTSNNSNNNPSSLHEAITNSIQDLTSSIHDLGNGIQEYFPLGVAAAPPSSPHKREVELIDVTLTSMDGDSPVATLPNGGTIYRQSSTHQRKISSLAAATGPLLPMPSSNSVQQLYELVFTLWCMTLDCYYDKNNNSSSSSRSDGCHERNLYYNNDATNSMRHHFVRDGAVSALAQLLNAAPREKVLRLALGSLKNLATMDGNEIEDAGNAVSISSHVDHRIGPSSASEVTSTTLVREMIACGVMKSLELLQLRQWNDEDLRDDLNMLQRTLQRHFTHLTQWKVYQSQLDAGVFKWNSLLHTESFFQRNAQFMEGSEGDFAPLKRLIEILARRTTQQTLSSSSAMTNHSFYYVGDVAQNVDVFTGKSFEEDDVDDDELCETLSICLHDLGEFARQYPNGRVLAKQLGANKLAMRYMHHPHTDVQQEALSCVSKLLVHDWRALGGVQEKE